MNQDSSSNRFQNNHTAVLFLPVPSEPRWYLKEIAGVPFLLRNILTLQELGIEKLVFWAEEPAREWEMFLEPIKADQRLQLKLNWINKESFPSILGASSFIIFDGSTLLNICGSQMAQIDAGNSKAFPEELIQCLNKKEIYFLKSESREQPERLRDE